MGSRIEMDFEQALRLAGQLEEIAAGVQSIADRGLPGAEAGIRAAWQGENACAYLTKMGDLREDVGGTASAIATAANALRADAKRLYEAEQEAARLANERKYSS